MYYRFLSLTLAFSFGNLLQTVMATEVCEYESCLDTTFGNNGIVITSFDKNSGTVNKIVPTIHVKTRSDGKIIMLGDSYNDAGKNSYVKVALVQYDSFGNLDKFFGNDGKLEISFAKQSPRLYYAANFAFQDDGKIILVARLFEKDITFPGFLSDPAIVRLNPDGSLDRSFGNNGEVRERNSGYDWSNFFGLKLQNDGKIVVAGNCGTNIPDGNKYKLDHCNLLIARYNNDGTPDYSFGDGGKVETILKNDLRKFFADDGHSLDIQPDGKIVVVGDYENMDDPATGKRDCAIARYDILGNLDSSFGENGIVITNVNDSDSFFIDVYVTPSGKIMALGSVKNKLTSKYDLLLIRYAQNGLLDTTFGNNGLVTTSILDCDLKSKDFALTKDGKILVTGTAKFGDISKFILIRYDSNGKLENTIITSVRGKDDKSFALVEQDDGKIIVCGDSFNGQYFDFALVRYNAF